MMARMKLGQIVATRGVVGLMRENNGFAAFVHRAFQRYLRADWGELCESDRKQNDRALAHGGDRILAAYTHPPTRSGKSGSLPSGTAALLRCCFPTNIERGCRYDGS